MSLVEHARRELELIGEEPDTIDWYCRVIAEFASFGHSGGSAMVTIPVLHELLQFHPLAPLTDDPADWIDHSEISSYPLWQNRRDSRAFSSDGGRTYTLLHEREAAGSDETTPLHHSEAAAERAGIVRADECGTTEPAVPREAAGGLSQVSGGGSGI